MPVTNYIWDVVSDNVLMEVDDNGNTIASYEHEPGIHGELISQRRNRQTYYHHYDGMGNTVAVTDENENVVETATYSAFGEVVQKTSSIVNPFGFKGALGYYVNPTTNNLDVRARVYEPATARWLSVDRMPEIKKKWQPETRTQPYIYVRNNPTNLADPSGLSPCDPASRRDKLPPNAVATVWCKDGKLEATIVNPIDPKTGRPKNYCILDCVIVHETVHVDQVNKWCPGFCQGCDDREEAIPRIPQNLSPSDAECPAYKAGRDCLLAHLRGGTGCDRIEILEEIRKIDDIVKDPRYPYQCPSHMPWPLPPVEDS